MKKIRCIICFTIIVLGFCNISNANMFYDVDEKHWAYEYILKIQEIGIIKGYNDGSFKPDKYVTREEFATVLSNFINSPAIKLSIVNNPVIYEDVLDARWSKEYITQSSVYLQGYLKDGNYYFEPENVATRMDVAIAITKALNLTMNNVDTTVLECFSDKAVIPKSNKEYISAIVNSGIMNGNANGTFNPEGKLTRAQMATIICNVLKYLENNEYGYYEQGYPLTLEQYNRKYTELAKTNFKMLEEQINKNQIENPEAIDFLSKNNTDDNDDDGIWDELEKIYSLDPTKKDSNNDGLVDAVVIFSDVKEFIDLTGDYDGDGLTNEEEILIYGTAFNNEDSDHDGLLDKEDIILGFNPLSKDSDLDGTSDYDEYWIILGGLNYTIACQDVSFFFEVDVICTPKEYNGIRIYEETANATAKLSNGVKVELNKKNGIIRVNVTNVKDNTPTLYYAKDQYSLSIVQGQYIKDNILYAPIEKNGIYVIIDEDKRNEGMYHITNIEKETYNSFWFLYTEIDSDGKAVGFNGKKIDYSLVKFNVESINGYKLYNKWGMKLQLKADHGYVNLAQNSLSPTVDFDAILILYSTDNGRTFEEAEYSIVTDERGRKEVRIKVNTSGVYGIFSKYQN